MKKLKPFNEDAEVIGSMFKSFFVSVNLDNFKDILQKYGLDSAEEIDPQGWYKHSLCMEIFREIEKRPAVFDEVSLGIASIKVGNLDQYFTSTRAALEALPGMNAASHRNTTDYIKVEFSGPNRATIEDHTIWPHDAMYGVFWELVRTFAADFVVRRTRVATDPVTGDEYGVYEIMWQDRVRVPVAS